MDSTADPLTRGMSTFGSKVVSIKFSLIVHLVYIPSLQHKFLIKHSSILALT